MEPAETVLLLAHSFTLPHAAHAVLRCSNALEDPWVEPTESMFTRSCSPEDAPDEPTYIEIEFEKVCGWVGG